MFSDTAIIIDGIAPYRWLNPNGPANWLADVEKWRANLGVTYEHLAYEMGFWNVEGSFAYAVIAGTLTVKTKNQTTVRTGTLAYTFAKRAGGDPMLALGGRRYRGNVSMACSSGPLGMRIMP